MLESQSALLRETTHRPVLSLSPLVATAAMLHVACVRGTGLLRVRFRRCRTHALDPERLLNFPESGRYQTCSHYGPNLDQPASSKTAPIQFGLGSVSKGLGIAASAAAKTSSIALTCQTRPRSDSEFTLPE